MLLFPKSGHWKMSTSNGIPKGLNIIHTWFGPQILFPIKHNHGFCKKYWFQPWNRKRTMNLENFSESWSIYQLLFCENNMEFNIKELIFSKYWVIWTSKRIINGNCTKHIKTVYWINSVEKEYVKEKQKK